MKNERRARWWLPPKPWQGPRAKPYLATFEMSDEQAKAAGALRIEPNTERWIDVPETPEEEREILQRTDTSKAGSGRI